MRPSGAMCRAPVARIVFGEALHETHIRRGHMSTDKGKDKGKNKGKDKGTRPDSASPKRSGEPDAGEDTAERGQFAGDNRGIQDDKSQGRAADHGQRGSQGGNKRGGSKG